MTKRLFLFFAIVATMSSQIAMADVVIEKSPDLGAFWNPLGPDSSYVYANSFVAEETGTVDELNMWLQSNNGPGAGGLVSFNVYGSVDGNPALGPDSTNVIASTGDLDIGGTDTLDKYAAPTLFSGLLTQGETYWFGANAIGNGPGSGGSYTVGGHTQNSQHNDNGTFWFSNDPSGIVFDGQNATPEMAFKVSIVNAIPEPASIAVLGLMSIVALRRRRS